MRRVFVATVLVVAILAPSQTIAASHNPTGDFAQFSECPLSRPTLHVCLHMESSGGFFQIGKKTLPLKNTVILQGGLEHAEGASALFNFFSAENGDTLSKTPQPVPGGLFGNRSARLVAGVPAKPVQRNDGHGFTEVTATIELAGPATSIKATPQNILLESGIALSLPVKIRLGNPLLGSNCYIGSNSNPMVIEFTSGETSPPPPNEPIKGSAGNFEINEAGTLITASGVSLVDNSFAAPRAKGCGGFLSFFVDPLVDSIVGLPSFAGTNAAVLGGDLKTAEASAVAESEE